MTEEIKDSVLLALGRLEGKMDMVIADRAEYLARFCTIEGRLGKVEKRAAAISALLGIAVSVIGYFIKGD